MRKTTIVIERKRRGGGEEGVENHQQRAAETQRNVQEIHAIALERIKATAGSQADLAPTYRLRPDPV